jgi:hypothetical protein
MPNVAVLVMGPAGAGKVLPPNLTYRSNVKTTFCTALMDTIAEQKQRASYINLDPAAEDFTWEPTIGTNTILCWQGVLTVDIRDLVSLQDVMEELDLGPNGGLVYCFEYPSPPVPASHAPPRCPPLSLTSCRILRLDT